MPDMFNETRDIETKREAMGMTKLRRFRALNIASMLILAAVVVLTFAVTPTLAAGNVSITRTFEPSNADSYVNQSLPSLNYGTVSPIYVRSYALVVLGQNQRSYITFDLSSLPAGSSISSSNLQMYLNTAPIVSRTHSVHRVTGDWSETGITWNNQPAYNSATSSTATGTTSGAWLSWPVTADLQAWIQYQTGTNYGWAIQDATEDSLVAYLGMYNTREATSNKPELSVTFTAPWDSYESDYSTIRDTYTSSNNTVYMKGTGFTDISYLIAYYDKNGVKRGSQTTSASGGVLQSSYLLSNSPPGSGDGTWHALVQPSSGYTGFGEASYSEITGSPDTYGLLADDSFYVEENAVPEFPTTFAAIAVAGLCSGIYYWMRRKKLAHVQA